MKKVRLGIVGAGGMGTRIHTPSVAEIENAEIVAIADIVEEKAKALAEKFGVKKTYRLHTDMLENEELDGVLVLVNPERTYWVANDCLNAGVHVLMEKPAGINAYQTHSLARTAKRVGKIAAVAMNRRHIPLVQEVLKRMSEVTTITQVDSRFMKYSDIATNWHYADAYITDIVHATDLLRYVAGGEVTKAATVVNRFDSPVDNAWSSVMLFDNGVTGTLRASYRCGARFHDIEIHGPGATAIITLGAGDTKCSAKIYYNSNGAMYSAASAGVNESRVDFLDAEELAGSDKYSHYFGYKAESVDFVNCIINGTEPLATIEDAAKTMDLVELLLEKRI